MQACKACQSPRRAELDADLLAGEIPHTQLSDTYRLPYGSVRRHKLANHVRGIVVANPDADDLGPTDLLSRYVAALRDSERVREFAVASRRPELLIRAAKESRSALEFLMTELGVDDLEIVRQLEHADTFARAMGKVVRQVPELASVLADKLRDEGDTELATVVENVGKTQMALKEKAA